MSDVEFTTELSASPSTKCESLMENLQGERERESESANGPMPVGSPDGYKGNKRKYTNEGHVLG